MKYCYLPMTWKNKVNFLLMYHSRNNICESPGFTFYCPSNTRWNKGILAKNKTRQKHAFDGWHIVKLWVPDHSSHLKKCYAHSAQLTPEETLCTLSHSFPHSSLSKHVFRLTRGVLGRLSCPGKNMLALREQTDVGRQIQTHKCRRTTSPYGVASLPHWAGHF